ncbi:peptidyl-tRNA hydrolase, mitochondrial-like isoform X1 [Oryza glaberrima]|uniref:peptidyl-tRNA hydrolase, mitochondrial-like isoform X1 n=1 Tax=Oryza glaberrima TaxID=4538 RepID=UPI00224C0146|nr:peptidyl-tRNA hydrolase, mitochondrial-like isoform X1 [Oryza glaberrima]XP_052154895.1 peptidyl-tRNA hydrolase, mitochondrial-like isoform X1 [Oryza glaberrima]
MIDMFAQSQGISPTRHHFKALFAEGMVEGVPVLLAKPQTHLMARTCPVEFFVYNLKEDSGAIMGIGCPPGQMDPKAFVLQKFNKTSLERIDSAIEEGVEILKLVVAKGL